MQLIHYLIYIYNVHSASWRIIVIGTCNSFQIDHSLALSRPDISNFLVCELLETGVAAIFGPKQYPMRDIVSSLTERFNVPHIEYSFRQIDDQEDPPASINVYPSSTMYQTVS